MGSYLRLYVIDKQKIELLRLFFDYRRKFKMLEQIKNNIRKENNVKK